SDVCSSDLGERGADGAAMVAARHEREGGGNEDGRRTDGARGARGHLQGSGTLLEPTPGFCGPPATAHGGARRTGRAAAFASGRRRARTAPVAVSRWDTRA